MHSVDEQVISPTTFVSDLPRQYLSAVTQQTAGFGKASELFAAKACVLAGQTLPKPRTRFAEASEIDGALLEMDGVVKTFTESLRRAGSRRALNNREQLTAIIRKASIQTGLTRFEDPEAMAVFHDRLDRTIARGEPVVLAMPEGGGKAPVPLKTGAGLGPDAAEFLSLKMRAAVVTVLREFYAGGAHMIIVPDAPLHTRDLGWNPTVVQTYTNHLWADLPRLGIQNDEVIFAHTLSFLPSNWYEALDRGTLEVRQRAEHDASTRTKLQEQTKSLLYIKAGEWGSEEKAVLAYATIAGDSTDVSADVVAMARDFERATEQAAALYTAVNHHGIYGLDLIGRVVAGLGFSKEKYIRCSVHAKPGHPRLALNIQNHMTPPGLLPMHSVGVKMLGDKPRWGLTFDIVARMRGWSAVHDEAGRFMYYEGAA